METRQRLLYPLLIVAALSVTVFSMVGIAMMTGALPSAHSEVVDSATRAQHPDATRAARDFGRAEERNATRVTDSSSPARREKVAAACASCGVVESIRVVERQGNGSGVGAVAGGLTGAVVGNQFGHGNGRAAMTVLGGLGGAWAGNTIEKNVNKTSAYQIKVRMDDGSLRVLSQKEQPAVVVGEKVRVENGSLVRRA